ncbi:MAG: type II secretion system F family protein [Hyphomicrobiales bacterium]|nr:type II secretion system F family protein [Hyphomicrobiales bacterium]
MAVFCAVYTLLAPYGRSGRYAARLKAVSRVRTGSRDETLKSLAGKPESPLRRKQANCFTRMIGGGKTDKDNKDIELIVELRMAGFRNHGAEAVFLFYRMACPVAFALLCLTAIALFDPKDMSASLVMTLTAASAALGYVLPRLIIRKLIERRQHRIMRAFPDALDLLLICVQSGLSVEAALGRVTEDIAAQSVELAEELGLTMAELSYLPIRWRAYANLGERIGHPAVKLITAALVQAERHGTSISQALNSAAHAGREARIAEAEFRAAALPPKLAVPLVVFFLPILLTVILAPAVIEAGRVLTKQSDHINERSSMPPETHRPHAASSSDPQ